jgi:hypothetical protein
MRGFSHGRMTGVVLEIQRKRGPGGPEVVREPAKGDGWVTRRAASRATRSTPPLSRAADRTGGSSSHLGGKCAATALPRSDQICQWAALKWAHAGPLPPLRAFAAAAIAADHTGAAHDIAGLLQAIEHRRDLELTFDSLARLFAARAPRLDVARRWRSNLIPPPFFGGSAFAR